MRFNQKYENELKLYVDKHKDVLNSLSGNTIMITGAAGLIGTYLIDIISMYNKYCDNCIKIVAIDRNKNELNCRFKDILCKAYFSFFVLDLNTDSLNYINCDYVIHAASNTSPLDYASKPIDTILCNTLGTEKLLKYCSENRIKRFLFCSSVEAYGAAINPEDEFFEDYSGYLNSNSLRASYPASKRLSEALCNAYNKQYDIDFVIARIGRIFGPTVLRGDAKAPTQFISNSVFGQNIVLKSRGTQLYSFGYVGDCASAILYLLINGKCGEAYNVATERIMLKDFAERCAIKSRTVIEFQLPNEVEKQGYSNITKAVMDTTKIESIGFSNLYTVFQGIDNTIEYLCEKWRN